MNAPANASAVKPMTTAIELTPLEAELLAALKEADEYDALCLECPPSVVQKRRDVIVKAERAA